MSKRSRRFQLFYVQYISAHFHLGENFATILLQVLNSYQHKLLQKTYWKNSHMIVRTVLENTALFSNNCDLYLWYSMVVLLIQVLRYFCTDIAFRRFKLCQKMSDSRNFSCSCIFKRLILNWVLKFYDKQSIILGT